MILDDDMSRERDFIREDVVAADLAVVRHMAADHEKIARADPRRLTFAAGPVKRTKLPNLIIVADFEITPLAAKLHILRLAAHHGMLKNPVSGPESGKPFDQGIGRDVAIWADFDVIFDYRCRMDRHLQGFEDNGVLWILQILFIMQDCLGLSNEGEPKSLCLVTSFAVASRIKTN